MDGSGQIFERKVREFPFKWYLKHCTVCIVQAIDMGLQLF